MVKSVVKRKATPSSLRRKKAQQRIRKKIAVKNAKKKPSWKATLKNVYNKKKDGNSTDSSEDPNNRKRKRYQNEEGDEVQEEVDEEKMKRMNERNPLDTQLFLKHLPFDTNEAELMDLLSRYGKIQRVFLTRSHATKQLTGTGFVHCGTIELADIILNFATQNARELSSSTKEEMKEKTEKMSHHQAKKLQFKLRGDTVEVRDPFIMVRDTRVTVHRVLSRTDSQEASSQNANNATGKKKKTTSVAADDPRNLYLLQEGRIEAGTPAAKGLPERYVQLLGQDYEQRRQMLKDTNMFVSKTRLNVRNLPKKYADRDVRKLFSDHARSYLKKHKEDMDKEKWGKYGPIKNVKLLCDGNGVSKGYAFVEFVNHHVALNVLRSLNNNPTLFGEQNRLVVSFAIENINAIQKLERIREIRKKKIVPGEE